MIGKELIGWRDKPLEQDYLIKKPPFQALFIFALPIIIGNLFQQTYTMADSAIVGRFVSEQALAAVLAATPFDTVEEARAALLPEEECGRIASEVAAIREEYARVFNECQQYA